MVNVSKITKNRIGKPPTENETNANLEKPDSGESRSELIQIRTSAEIRKEWDILKATYGFKTNDKMVQVLLDIFKQKHGAY